MIPGEIVKCNTGKLYGILTAIDSSGRFEVYMLDTPTPRQEVVEPAWLYAPTESEKKVIEQAFSDQLKGIRAGNYQVPQQLPKCFDFSLLKDHPNWDEFFYLDDPHELEVMVQLSPPAFLETGIKRMTLTQARDLLRALSKANLAYLSRLLGYDCMEIPEITQLNLAHPSQLANQMFPHALAKTNVYIVYEDMFRAFPPQQSLVHGDIHVIF